MEVLFRGIGGDWAPHAPSVEKLLNDRLLRRGYRGQRSGTSVFGSTSKSHAYEYARYQTGDYLRVLEPQAGAIISWAPGVRDLLLKFAGHLNELRWNGVESLNGVKVGALLRDMGGECDIADTYLAMGRQRRQLSAIADAFFDDQTIVEHEVSSQAELSDLLDGHNGEVWLSGPCRVSAYDPALHEEFPWIGSTNASLRR